MAVAHESTPIQEPTVSESVRVGPNVFVTASVPKISSIQLNLGTAYAEDEMNEKLDDSMAENASYYEGVESNSVDPAVFVRQNDSEEPPAS